MFWQEVVERKELNENILPSVADADGTAKETAPEDTGRVRGAA